ncbi:class I lanthipeptide [Chitinophaga japonensis]|uniref:Uncharacterized protein n=1 Tax=Chitinophaga japonensis TaxID=104662 RepID=A0A562SJU1_CHIJA|nr:class I lanthipeptide [Chitinophaga japonensis]TWI81060.1 hypothetical protein LX66_5669 [Chitinophaga japonensis]
MRKSTEKKEQKLKLNKVTVIKLDAEKMHMLWGGGIIINTTDASGRPQCDTRETALQTL